MSIESSPTPSQPDNLTIPAWVNSGHPSVDLGIPNWVNSTHPSVRAALEHGPSEEPLGQRCHTSAQCDLPVSKQPEAARSPRGEVLKRVGVYALLGAATLGVAAAAWVAHKNTATTECDNYTLSQGDSVVGAVQAATKKNGWKSFLDTESISEAHAALNKLDREVHPGDTVTVCYTESALPFSGSIEVTEIK